MLLLRVPLLCMTEPDENPSSPRATVEDDEAIAVEVVCALPGRQEIVALKVPCGTTARQAVRRAQLGARFPELDLATAPLAVYGSVVDGNHGLAAGDRVEVLRPLQREPRDARRELAARGQTMGSRPAPADD